MNILFLSAHLPSPHARQAGQKISYYLCQFLAQRHSVQLLALCPDSELERCGADYVQTFTSRTVISVTAASRLLGIVRAPFLPLGVAVRKQTRFRHALASAVRRKPFDVVIFDHMAMWQYAGHVPSTAIRTGIAHDVLSQLWARKANNDGALAARLESWRLRNWERAVIRDLDLICALSTKDSQLIAEWGGDLPRCVLQPWFSRASGSDTPAASRKEPALIFTGAFDRDENVDAAKFAVAEILPQVTRAVPQFAFYLAGASSETLPRQVRRHAAVRVAGFVPDLRSFLLHMQIALLPLRLGAGIKTKVLECMAAGLPVITTPVGAEGIPGRDGVHFLIGRTAEELAGHAILLLRNRSLRNRIGESAKEFIRTNYDFESSAREFERMLMQCVSQRQSGKMRMNAPATKSESDIGASRAR
jgi:glycosyltransferase involved in cell wall biosynthesis